MGARVRSRAVLPSPRQRYEFCLLEATMNPAASANGVPADRHFPAHGHVNPLQPRDHWPQMPPQNQPQQFHGLPWQQSQPVQLPSAPTSGPQAQAQGYQNPPQYYQNHSSNPFDLSSIVPQQIMQDFLRLSTPVGSSPNDDTILAQALHESRQAGRTYRQALEGLHGVGHVSGHLMCLLRLCASRSITTLQISGKTITWTTTTVSTSSCPV